jgi:3-hydroxyisobutyrate dehydrogenase-like beta-hydroxyacid dehydrogenase
MARVGLLHPGAMGAALGAQLVGRGHQVLWASRGRSGSTAARATRAGLLDVGSIDELLRRSELVISVCPPHAAVETARSASGFAGPFLDANAVSPATAAAIAHAVGGRTADGGIVGPPPTDSGTTRLYLSGSAAPDFQALFTGTAVGVRVLDDGGPYAASALKMAFAAWSKGSAALLLATADAADRLGVGDALAHEWAISRPRLAAHLEAAQRDAAEKGWRWAGEMDEIAATFSDVGLSPGFHEAAASTYRSRPQHRDPA